MGRKVILLAGVAVLTLAACGKKEQALETSPASDKAAKPAEAAKPAATEKAPELPAGFPKMTASYRAVYQANMDALGQKEVTIEAAGAKKFRFEMPHFNAERAAAGAKIVGVFDDAADRSVMFVEGPDAKNIAVVVPQQDNPLRSFLNWASEDESLPKKTGSEKIAGLSCDIWEAPAGEGETPGQACITRDGIILKAGDAGAAAPEILAVKVDKGAIDAARFAVPVGFEIVDTRPCQEAATRAMADAQSGKAPDMALIAQCSAIGLKAAEVFGDIGR